MDIFHEQIATWLVDKTCLSFRQIAISCNLSIYEVTKIADDTQRCPSFFDPVLCGLVRARAIKEAEFDQISVLEFKKKRYSRLFGGPPSAKKKARLRRNAVLWFIRNFPYIPDRAICAFLSTPQNVIGQIRRKYADNFSCVQPIDPATLGLCTKKRLNDFTRTHQHEMVLHTILTEPTD